MASGVFAFNFLLISAMNMICGSIIYKAHDLGGIKRLCLSIISNKYMMTILLKMYKSETL